MPEFPPPDSATSTTAVPIAAPTAPSSAEPSGATLHAATALTAHTIKNLRAGDLVAVNQSLVNGRAWMSTAANVKAILAKGEQAELLSGPIRSCGFDWVKLRPLGSAIECYVAARFLDLIEANASAIPAALSPPPGKVAGIADYKTGDIIVTASNVKLRTGAGAQIIQTLASNMLGAVLTEPWTIDSVDWVQVQFPNASGWLAARYTRLFASGEKWIEVNLSTQTLTAWDGATNVSTSAVSSGKSGFATPTGAFSILEKHPARRTKASVRGEEWNIPGVPWVMIFRAGGFYIHGVYWHDDFGAPVSHGCVTLPVPYAEWLYDWTPVGAPLWIHG